MKTLLIKTNKYPSIVYVIDIYVRMQGFGITYHVEAFRSLNKIWLCYFFVHFYCLFSSATDQYELVLLVM